MCADFTFSPSCLDLLDLYCGFFNAGSRAINRVLVSRIVHTVVKGCCSQTDGLNHTLFSFFSKALLHARYANVPCAHDGSEVIWIHLEC